MALVVSSLQFFTLGVLTESLSEKKSGLASFGRVMQLAPALLLGATCGNVAVALTVAALASYIMLKDPQSKSARRCDFWANKVVGCAFFGVVANEIFPMAVEHFGRAGAQLVVVAPAVAIVTLALMSLLTWKRGRRLREHDRRMGLILGGVDIAERGLTRKIVI